MRERNFNLSDFVTNCLERLLNGENQEIANLINEERALRARLAEIQTKIANVQSFATQQISENNEKTQADYEKKKELEMEQIEAQKLFESDPKAYAKKYLVPQIRRAKK